MKRNGGSVGRALDRGIARRKAKGCFDFTTRSFLLDNVLYKSCIGNYTLQGMGYYLELYSNYEKGIFPLNKSLGDHPNKLIEIIHVIDDFKRQKDKAAK